MTTIDGARRRDTDPVQEALDRLPTAASTARSRCYEMDPHAILTSKTDDVALATFARSALKTKDISAPTPTANQPTTAPPSNKDVIYIGMNGGESTEGAALARGTPVHMAPHDDKAKLDGRTYDLKNPADCEAFALALTKDPARAAKLSAVLQSSGARSEVAHLAMLLARGDNGTGPTPSRIVLSGHNIGDGPYGARSLAFAAVQDVAAIFPKGASAIESIQFSACSSASELNVNRAQWLHAFPGLTSMWGYDGTCPLAASGGADFARQWEQKTHGDAELRTTGADRAANVAVWTAQHGYDSSFARNREKQTEALARATDAIDSARTEGYRTGSYPSAQHHGQLEGDYRALQSAAARSDLPPELHARLVAEAAKVGAIFTFDHHDGVRDRFAAAYGKEMNAALREAGLPTMDFTTMSYDAALDVKKQIDDQVAASSEAPASLLVAQRRMTELLSLDPRRTDARRGGTR